MTFLLELIVSLLIVFGGAFALVGSIGLVKLPDLLTRLQAKGPDLLTGLLLTKQLVLCRLLGLKEVLRLRLCASRGCVLCCTAEL